MPQQQSWTEDCVAVFRGYMLVFVAQELEGISSWEVLTAHLHDEQYRPDEQQITTNTVKTLLGIIGLSWSEWNDLNGMHSEDTPLRKVIEDMKKVVRLPPITHKRMKTMPSP